MPSVLLKGSIRFFTLPFCLSFSLSVSIVDSYSTQSQSLWCKAHPIESDFKALYTSVLWSWSYYRLIKHICIFQVVLVGLVRSSSETSTRLDYEIDDMTDAPLAVRQFVDNDVTFSVPNFSFISNAFNLLFAICLLNLMFSWVLRHM